MDKNGIQIFINALEYDLETVWCLIDNGRNNDSVPIMERVLDQVRSFKGQAQEGPHDLEGLFPDSFWEKDFRGGLKIKDMRHKIQEISQGVGGNRERTLEKIRYKDYFFLVRAWVSDNIYLLKKRIKSPQQKKIEKSIIGLLAGLAALCVLYFLVSNSFTQGWGLRGDFYAGEHFDKYIRTEIKKTIDFNSPEEMSDKIPHDQYSVRWHGYLLAPDQGTYTLSMEVDDGAKLYIDGQLLIDVWNLGRYYPSKKIILSKGSHKIVLEYFQHDGPATMQLYWSRGGAPEGIIPAKYLRYALK